MGRPINIFVSYAHEDDAFLKQLLKHLKPVERDGKISIWTDKEIVAGEPWDAEIKNKLDQAQIVLLLVSPDFIASDYIHDNEISRVIKTQRQKIIQIVVRPVYRLPIEHLQAIPPGDKAVSEWSVPDRPWIEVRSHLENAFEEVRIKNDSILSDGSNKDTTCNNKIDTNEKILFYTISFFPILIMLISFVAFIITFSVGLAKDQPIFLSISLLFLAAAFIVYFISRRFTLLPSLQ